MAPAIREQPRSSLQEVTFRLDASRIPNASAVALVGSFNRWDSAVHRLARGADGWWSITVILPPGEYRYLFLVDGFPHNDPSDDGRIPCEWGGFYSVRNVR